MGSQYNTIVYLLAGILLLGGLIFVFYEYLYKPASFDNYKLIDGVYEFDQQFESTVPLGKLAPNRSSLIMSGYGHGLTFTWAMNLDQVGPERIWATSYSRDKPIVRVGNSPQIYYNPKYNVLKVIVAYKETPFFSHYPVIELRDLPLQAWNKYAVVIEANRVKIYFNGQLVVNKVLANIPVIESTDIIVGERNNNIIGKIQDLKVYYRPYDNRAIKNII